MSPPSRSSASWERVLAAVEADAARAAALLISDDPSASAGIAYDGYDAAPAMAAPADDATGVPATWRLPVAATGNAAAGPALTGGAAARAVAGYAAATGSAPAPSAALSKLTGSAPGSAPSVEQNSAPAVAASSGSATAPINGAASAGPANTIAPGETGEPGSMQLPDPADMPPMTPEQQERFAALHTRITELQGQLAAAMAEAESVLARTPARRPDPQPRPELVDRRL